VRHLVEDCDLAEEDVRAILDLAEQARLVDPFARRNLVVGLLFLAPSTRTSFGFAAATARLGGCPVPLAELRFTGAGLPPESLADTLRVLSGMSDILVCRPPHGVSLAGRSEGLIAPLVNGGDSRGHPTQALIDLFAMQTLAGPLAELHIGISGDLDTRVVRSLLHHLDMVRPQQLTLLAPPGRGLGPDEVPVGLRERTRIREEPDFSGLDVLVLPGLAPLPNRPALAVEDHERWGFSPQSAPSLPSGAVVLSPGPVISEIDPRSAGDPRIRVFEQADLSTAVRVGVLQWLLEMS
jgi:aspartate carbamoyltransferase catalytic subunit